MKGEHKVKAETLLGHSLPLGKLEKGARYSGWRWSCVWVHSLVGSE